MIFILFGNYHQFTSPYVVGLVTGLYLCWRRELSNSLMNFKHGRYTFGERQISDVFQEEEAGKSEEEVT